MSAQLTWLGHGTVLVEIDGVALLTDPVLRSRVAHLRRRGPRPAVPERVDAILISHVHYDHLDLRSLQVLPRSARIVVPRGAGRLVRRYGFAAVDEVDAGDTLSLDGLRVDVVPAEHGTVRRLVRELPAVGFVARGSRSVYYAGDTDLFARMAELRPVDVACLPVSGWGPRLPAGHLNPERAAEALALLRPRIAVPIHWGTLRTPFSRGSDSVAPVEFAAAAARRAPGVAVRVIQPGESLAV
jgi:L-ascorbate metabolism protein UlaG (beta-lactamase superfamily)